MGLPGWLGPALFGAGILLSAGFALAGLARLGGTAMRLQRRLETMKELPISAAVERTTAQLDATRARIEALPALLWRAKVALETLDESRRRLTEAATSASGIIGLARFLFAPPTKN
jgi:hypothetical protein